MLEILLANACTGPSPIILRGVLVVRHADTSHHVLPVDDEDVNSFVEAGVDKFRESLAATVATESSGKYRNKDVEEEEL